MENFDLDGELDKYQPIMFKYIVLPVFRQGVKLQ